MSPLCAYRGRRPDAAPAQWLAVLREVISQSAAIMHLDCGINYLLGHVRLDDCDLGNLTHCLGNNLNSHKPGSWLNMAEIELNILSCQCLDQRIADQDSLKVAVAAWENDRNQVEAKKDWQFTTEDARVKLEKLYPSIPLK